MADNQPRPVRRLPSPNDGQGRVESGPLQVGEDWPGLFIRGDEAFGLAMSLKAILTYLEDHPEAGRQVFFAIGDLRRLYKDILTEVIIGGTQYYNDQDGREPPKVDIEV